MLISNIKKNYGSYSTVVLYTHEFKAEPPCCSVHYAVNCQICFKRGKLVGIDELNEQQLLKYNSNRLRSTRRAKNMVTDYALCNDFELFITLTFDQKLTDSFNYDYCKKLVTTWLNNQRRTSPDLKYILVAEKHISGAIHFHALLHAYLGKLDIAINNKKTSMYFGQKLVRNGKQIYNLNGWKYGYSTASYIDNKQATARYIQKYLSKDFIEAFNKKRYWVSRGLKKPEKSYNIDFLKEKENYPPLFSSLYKTDSYYLYTWIHGAEALHNNKLDGNVNIH